MYPWAGFSSFVFTPSEQPMDDTHWKIGPNYSRRKPLGSTVDSIVTLGIGSADRTLEDIYFEPDRFATLQSLVNTLGTFTDWDRPVPDSRSAFLANVIEVERVAVACADNSRRMKIKARIELVSQ